MSQLSPRDESLRTKFILASVACILVGLTFAIIPVQATQIDKEVSNYSIGNSLTFNLGYAQPGYVISGSLVASGPYRITIRNVAADTTLFSADVSAGTTSIPPITVNSPGDIQVQVTTRGGSSATLNASLQHSTTNYPLMIPGILLLIAGGALMLTRGVKIGVSLSAPAG